VATHRYEEHIHPFKGLHKFGFRHMAYVTQVGQAEAIHFQYEDGVTSPAFTSFGIVEGGHAPDDGAPDFILPMPGYHPSLASHPLCVAVSLVGVANGDDIG
jgi:hypothetical protein